MILLASLRSDGWTAWSEHVDEFIGLRNHLISPVFYQSVEGVHNARAGLQPWEVLWRCAPAMTVSLPIPLRGLVQQKFQQATRC